MEERPKETQPSPTEIALQNGLPVVGLGDLSALGDVVPGQSGAEGLADLPNARAEDPWDGP